MSLALIVHTAAGGGRAGRALAGVQAALRKRGLPHHVQLTESLEHARRLARRAAAAGETAVAFGGDGLIGAVAAAVRGGDGILGVLPGGRGNDIARALGIPLDPVAACEVLATGAVHSLDLGDVASRSGAALGSFIGIASCGFDSDANRIANQTSLVRGNLVYAYGALRALAGWRTATFTIQVDGGSPRTFRGYSVAVANSRSYGGGMLIAPDASPRDGQLDVVTIADMSRARFLALLPTVFKGLHVRLANVDVVRARQIEISADRPFTLFADGDPIGELPLTVRIAPDAVRVLAPR